jgi:hypothetical protein
VNAAGSRAELQASGRRGFQSSELLDQLLKTGPATEIKQIILWVRRVGLRPVRCASRRSCRS